jgi:hypothetical protein
MRRIYERWRENSHFFPLIGGRPIEGHPGDKHGRREPDSQMVMMIGALPHHISRLLERRLGHRPDGL